MASVRNKKTILVVDDAPENIDAMTGILQDDYQVKVALRGKKALELVQGDNPPDLILLDIVMPEMDGYEVCRRLKADPATREIPVIFVTGLDSPMDEARGLRLGAVDFINKPLQPLVILARVATHMKLKSTTAQLRTTLSKTFLGSIRLLTDILSLTNPQAFNQASRIKEYIANIIEYLEVGDSWRFETAALLSNIGCVTLAPDLMGRILDGKNITEKEKEIYQSHPVVGRDLLADIPGLETVAEMVFHQQDTYDPKVHKGPPQGWDPVKLGGLLLRMVIDFDRQTCAGETPESILTDMTVQNEIYCPELVKVLAKIHAGKPKMVELKLNLNELRAGMILTQDLYDAGGTKIVGAGCELTPEILRLIHRYDENNKLKQPIQVKYAN